MARPSAGHGIARGDTLGARRGSGVLFLSARRWMLELGFQVPCAAVVYGEFLEKYGRGSRMMSITYEAVQPTRATIDALAGATVLEFGTDWCGYCRAAQSLLADALAAHPQVRHIKVEDGSGRALGRSFRVKLWPTVIFLLDGKEVARVVRPAAVAEVRQALAQTGLAA